MFTEKDLEIIQKAAQGNHEESGNGGDAGGSADAGDAGGEKGKGGDAGNGEGGKGGNGGTQTPPAFTLEQLGFKDEDEVKSLRTNYEKLTREHEEYKNKPLFKSDKQKMLFDFATQRFEGEELGGAQKFLSIVALDLAKVPDQDLRFKAFELRPENKGLSQEELMTLFADKELKDFGDVSNENAQTPAQKIYAKQATAQARAEIEKIQNEFKEAKTALPPTPEEIASQKSQYLQHVQKQLSTFEGIQTKLSAQTADGKPVESTLNFKLTPEQKASIEQLVADPQSWFDQVLTGAGVIQEGKEVNTAKFAELALNWVFGKEIANQSYQQGRSELLAELIKDKRNIELPSGDKGGSRKLPHQGQGGTESQEAVRGAMKHMGLN